MEELKKVNNIVELFVEEYEDKLGSNLHVESKYEILDEQEQIEFKSEVLNLASLVSTLSNLHYRLTKEDELDFLITNNIRNRISKETLTKEEYLEVLNSEVELLKESIRLDKLKSSNGQY